MWCDAFVFVNRTLQIFTFYQTLMTRSAVPALNALIFLYIQQSKPSDFEGVLILLQPLHILQSKAINTNSNVKKSSQPACVFYNWRAPYIAPHGQFALFFCMDQKSEG